MVLGAQWALWLLAQLLIVPEGLKGLRPGSLEAWGLSALFGITFNLCINPSACIPFYSCRRSQHPPAFPACPTESADNSYRSRLMMINDD